MQVEGTCSRCGYMSSNAVCKACSLIEGLERGVAAVAVRSGGGGDGGSPVGGGGGGGAGGGGSVDASGDRVHSSGAAAIGMRDDAPRLGSASAVAGAF